MTFAETVMSMPSPSGSCRARPPVIHEVTDAQPGLPVRMVRAKQLSLSGLMLTKLPRRMRN